MSSDQELVTWAYELDDGVPVNESVHRAQDAVSADVPTSRVPFGDVTGNFAEYYAPFLDSPATADLKSPERTRRVGISRFSPNRPPGSGAAKRLLWNKDLPPLPPVADSHEQPVASVSEDAAARESSPTRHTQRSTSATEAHAPPPMPIPDIAGLSDVDADLIRSLSIASTGTAAGQCRPLAHRGLLGGALGGALGPNGVGGGRGALPFPLPTDLGSQSEASGLAAHQLEEAPPEEGQENRDDLKKKQPSSSETRAGGGVLGCALPR